MTRAMPQTDLLLATGNPHKADELRELLASADMGVLSLADLPEEIRSLEPVEDQPTLEGNARLKARFWAERTSHPVLADDTGLEVDALGGEPGVLSARYAGADATYRDNVRLLLERLTQTGLQPPWPARFRTVLAFIDENRDEHLFEGVCTGQIVPLPKGEGGFGYDPVFRPTGSDLTFSEMPPAEKNAISHRGRALRAFHDWIGSRHSISVP